MGALQLNLEVPTLSRDDGKEYKVYGQPLVCPLCANKSFWKDDTKIEQAYFSLRPQRPGFRLTCTHCKYILWFED